MIRSFGFVLILIVLFYQKWAFAWATGEIHGARTVEPMAPDYSLELEASVGVTQRQLRANERAGLSGLEAFELSLTVEPSNRFSFSLTGASEPIHYTSEFWVKEAYLEYSVLSGVHVSAGQMHYPLGLARENEFEFSRPSLVFDELYYEEPDIDVGATLKASVPWERSFYLKTGLFNGSRFRSEDGRTGAAEVRPRFASLGYQWSSDKLVEFIWFKKDLAFQDPLESYGLTLKSGLDLYAQFSFLMEGELWRVDQVGDERIVRSYVGSLIPTLMWKGWYIGARYSQKEAEFFSTDMKVSLPTTQEFLWRAGVSLHSDLRVQVERVQRHSLKKPQSIGLVDEWVGRLLFKTNL